MVLGIDQTWVYLNDPYESLAEDSPAVANYLALSEVQEHVSIIPYNWVYTEKNQFRK
jgi:hypothetical protein